MYENTVKMLDVSAWQGDIDWSKVRAADYQLAVLKVSEGGDVHRGIEERAKKAHEAGFLLGFYNFVRPERAPERANETLKKLLTNDLPSSPFPVALDIEAKTSVSPAKYIAYCEALAKLIAEWHKPGVWVYTSQHIVSSRLGGKTGELGQYKLWVPRYGRNSGIPETEPTLPKAWKEWTAWQYTSNGKVPGFKGGVDISLVKKSFLAELGIILAVGQTEKEKAAAAAAKPLFNSESLKSSEEAARTERTKRNLTR